jgi:phosphatidylglycerol:prolipoprotein diacylglycerol transferase
VHPILFQIGPLTLRTYGLMLALGFLAGIALAVSRARRRGFDPDMVMDLCFYLIVGGILGARILYVVEYPFYYLANPLSALKIWEGGLVFYGGLLGAVAVLLLFVRHRRLDLPALADVLAPSVILGQAIGRLGCFAAGCCHGLPTERWWGVTFTDPLSLAPRGVSLHPAQLYFAAADLVIFALLLVIDRRRRFAGQTMVAYLGLYAVTRFGLEFLRGDDRGVFFGLPLSPAQGISLLMLTAAAILWWRLPRRLAGTMPSGPG